MTLSNPQTDTIAAILLRSTVWQTER